MMKIQIKSVILCPKTEFSMNQNENIYTLSLLRLLSEGKLDPGRGQFYDNQCFVMVNPQIDEVEEGEAMFLYPTRLDCFVILLCDQGEFTLICNLQQITIQAGTVFYAQPGAILQVTNIHDCRTSVLLFGEQFMRQINLSVQSLLPHIGTIGQLYTLRPEPETFAYMWRQIEMLAGSIGQPATLAYYHETVRNTFRAFGYTFISDSGKRVTKRVAVDQGKKYRFSSYVKNFSGTRKWTTSDSSVSAKTPSK